MLHKITAHEFLATLGDAIVIASQGGIVATNGEADRLFGYDHHELVGQPIEILVPASKRTHHVVLRDAYFANPKARAMGAAQSIMGVRKDGTEFPADIKLSPLPVDGEVYTVASVRDKSALRELAELHEARERLQSVVAMLEAPCVPIWSGVVLSVVTGLVDSQRAERLIEVVLAGIERHAAHTLILDLAGVPLLDSAVAAAMEQCASAVKLIGARTIVTGMRGSVARTCAGLGLTFAGMVTYPTLQAGLAAAIKGGAK